jgi:lipopolysaccharide export system protein LptA
MRISVERLRIGLLVGAGLLVVVIAAFLGYARYRVRRGIANLPGRLGATITRESNGYTYSQSDGKNTIFTIHAAKAVEHTDGKYTLHDVQMVLYGHKGDRADRISGSEFEYDTKAQVIRAVGQVHIDLEAPVAQGTAQSDAAKHLGAAGAGVGQEAGAGSRVIHVTTSGLVYVRKLATAATDQGIEFAFGGFTGHAVGAEYNSDSGHLVLQSAVTVSGLGGKKDGGKPLALAASHAELDRASDEADFSEARYSSAGEVAQAEMAHLHLRADGTVERIEGVGRVVLEDVGHGRATSDRAEVSLDAANKPQKAVLTGNVKLNEDEAFRQASGDSRTAELTFDEQGRIDHAVLRGGVHTNERVRASDDAKAPWSERTLMADTVELALVAEGTAGKSELRDATATGSARLTSVSTVLAETVAKAATNRAGKRKAGTQKAGTTTTKLAADELVAHFVDAHGGAEISTVHGVGHTVLEQSAPGGIEQTSRSETMEVRFRQVDDAVAGGKGSMEIAEAVQSGGVVIDRTAPAKSGKPGAIASAGKEIQHRVAGRAVYDADSDMVTLTDGVEMSDETIGTKSDGASTILAAKVVANLESGDATAEGGVKVTYLQAGEAEPVHVLAARAELEHDAGRATFYGRAAGSGPESNSGLARMWQAATAKQGGSGQGEAQQGGSQIEAPVLVLEQAQKRLTARAARPGVMGTVHTVLSNAKPQRPGSAATKSASKAIPKTGLMATNEQQMPVRITSSAMVYSDDQRQAVFSGGVRVVDADGEMRAQEATVFLRAAQTKSASGAKTPTSSGMPGGQVERIVATRHVELTQPGLLATGERLVYTASDQMFVLTGTGAVPPKVVDEAQGTTTGAALRFRSGDDSVSVTGSDGIGPARKVHTETYTKAGAKQQ